MRRMLFNTPTAGAGGEAQGGGGGGAPATPAPIVASGGAPLTASGVPAAQAPPGLSRTPKADAMRAEHAAEAAKEQAAKEAAPDPALALLDAELPEGHELATGGHKIGKSYDEILKHATPELKQLVANLRANATQRNQSAAERERQAAEVETRAKTELADVHARMQGLHSDEFRANLAQLQAAAKNANPLTREGQLAIQEAKAAELFEKMLKPELERHAEAVQQARNDAYVAANPDIKEPATRKIVLDLLASRDDLSLQDAHEIARGRVAVAELAKLRAEKTAAADGRKKTLAMTGAGGQAGPVAEPVPKGLNAMETYDWLKARGRDA